ncbi:MAG: twin-arginine translocation signal domain-containing protein [Hyphomicrobiaceae bacterium]
MDRRSFLKTTTAAAAASTAAVGAAQARQVVSAPAVVPARTELRVAASSRFVEAARRLMRDITIASVGGIVINVVEEAVMADDIASGHCDAVFGHLPEIYRAPELSLFSGLPGLLAVSPEHHLAWHEVAGGDLFLEEVTAPRGLMALVAGHSGAGTGIWATSEIDGLRAFAEADISSQGLGRLITNRISDAFDRPQNGAARPSLVELPLSPLEAFGELPSNARQVWYRDGLHAQGFSTTLILSRNIWDSLNAGDQLLIATLARAAAHMDVSHARVRDRLEVPAIMNSLALRRAPLPADIIQAIQHTAVDVVHAELSQKREIARAFEAYGAFYQAMIGTPLPGLPGQGDPSV